MANDLTHPRSLAIPADLSARLSASCPKLDGWDTEDEALPFLAPAEARRIQRDVEDACEPADIADLMAELGRLSAVTTSQRMGDSDVMLASTRILARALQDYPADAALSAVRDWPQTDGGKWWPTENELRAEADKRSASRTRLRDHVRHHAAQSDPRAPRRTEPFGKTAAFVAKVREIRGDPYVRSWLSGTTCQFEDAVIWTSNFGCGRLNNDWSVLRFDMGIRIESDEQSRAHFNRQTEIYAVMAAEKAQPKRKRGGEG